MNSFCLHTVLTSLGAEPPRRTTERKTTRDFTLIVCAPLTTSLDQMITRLSSIPSATRRHSTHVCKYSLACELLNMKLLSEAPWKLKDINYLAKLPHLKGKDALSESHFLVVTA